MGSVRSRFEAGHAIAEVAHAFGQEIYTSIEGAAIGADAGFQGTDIGVQPTGERHHQGSLCTGHAYHRSQVRGQLSAETNSPSRHRHVSRAGPRIT